MRRITLSIIHSWLLLIVCYNISECKYYSWISLLSSAGCWVRNSKTEQWTGVASQSVSREVAGPALYSRQPGCTVQYSRAQQGVVQCSTVQCYLPQPAASTRPATRASRLSPPSPHTAQWSPGWKSDQKYRKYSAPPPPATLPGNYVSWPSQLLISEWWKVEPTLI